MIVGIFPDGASVAKLAGALASNGADTGSLHVLGCDDVPTELATLDVHYVWIGDVQQDVPTAIMTGDHGMAVPGLDNFHVGGSIGGDELMESLADLCVPDGRSDDYARAIEEGRLVVGFPAGTDPDTVRAAFSQAGAAIVEHFS